MKLWLIKSDENKLTPYRDNDYELAKKIPILEPVLMEYIKVRNYAFHKKYFGLLNLVFNNQEQYNNFENFRRVMQMKAGYFDEQITDKGIVYLPKSISFEELDQVAFEKLYSDVLDVLIAQFKFDKESIENELINFM